MSEREKSVVGDWVHKVIHGVGGFEDFERHEYPVFSTSREEAIAAFVVRALANTKSEGSREVLMAIHEKRLDDEQASVGACPNCKHPRARHLNEFGLKTCTQIGCPCRTRAF